MEMKNVNWKELFIDILVDIVAGMIIAVGIYNFALNADFPVAGFSGIAIILYHIFGLPVGAGTIILNVPVAIFCYKFLGKEFFLKSMKSMIISSLLMDYKLLSWPLRITITFCKQSINVALVLIKQLDFSVIYIVYNT